MNRSNFFNNNRNYNDESDRMNQRNCCNNRGNDCYDCMHCPPGPAGGVLGFADFYALMPPDNAAVVAPGTDVSFPENGPIGSTNITRTSASSFNLTQIGSYQVLFEVSV